MDRAPSLVLQPGDVPSGLARFESGPDNPRGRSFQGEPEAGLLAEWVARYRNVDPSATRGPLVVESRAGVFAGKEEAAGQLRPRASAAVPRAGPVSVPRIGDETIPRTFTQTAMPRDVRYFVIVWRSANVIASITVQGFEGSVRIPEVVALARAQQRRIARAAE